MGGPGSKTSLSGVSGGFTVTVAFATSAPQ